jgi:hypothetical protein
MNKRTLILITITLAVSVLQALALVNGQAYERKGLRQTEEFGAAAEVTSSQVKETVTILPIEPTPDRPPKTTRPTFTWRTDPSGAGLTYDFVLWEEAPTALARVDATGLEDGRAVFEQRGIRATEVAYPETLSPLDPTKVYAWAVLAYDIQGSQVGHAITAFRQIGPPPIIFPPGFCGLILTSPFTYSFCQSGGTFISSISWLLFTVPPGPPNATWTLIDPNANSTSGTVACGGSLCPGNVPISWPANQPGTYQWTLTVTRGNCTRKQTITLYVYPKLQVQIRDYPTSTTVTNICWGDDATLNMLDVFGNAPPSGCQVTWEYSANGGSTWNPLGQGNPFNTNPITSTNPLFGSLNLLCNPPTANITLQFRGTLDPNCLNLPQAWPAACPNVMTTSLKVWCPTQPGTISASPGIKICSNNNPVNVTLTLSGQVGTVTGWTVNGNPITGSAGQTTITYPITSAGTYQFCATVQNGPCAPAPACVTVIVEDPINGTIKVTQNGVITPSPVVCWGDDKVTMTFVPTNPLPPGTIIKWEYQINCTLPWINSNVTGLTQNSNDLILTPFYPAVNPCLVDKVCWQVTVQSPTLICPATIVGPVTIKVIKPFDRNNPPVISPAQPPVKCPGQPVTLTVTNYNNCATGPFTFQWSFNGLPVPGATSASINAVDPGNYTVEVCNMNKCDCIETAVVTVRDCITVVEIQGPCCKAGQTVTLTAAIVSSQVFPPGGPPSNCGGPYTYLWSTGATTPSITIPCPSTTTIYWVEVTNAMGCKTKVFRTVKACQ